jgi:hypothetical protein
MLAPRTPADTELQRHRSTGAKSWHVQSPCARTAAPVASYACHCAACPGNARSGRAGEGWSLEAFAHRKGAAQPMSLPLRSCRNRKARYPLAHATLNRIPMVDQSVAVVAAGEAAAREQEAATAAAQGRRCKSSLQRQETEGRTANGELCMACACTFPSNSSLPDSRSSCALSLPAQHDQAASESSKQREPRQPSARKAGGCEGMAYGCPTASECPYPLWSVCVLNVLLLADCLSCPFSPPCSASLPKER